MIRLSPTATISVLPALVDQLIERVPAIAGSAEASPVAWAGDLPLLPLLRDLEAGRPASDIVRHWSRAMPPGHARQLLNTLLAERILTPC